MPTSNQVAFSKPLTLGAVAQTQDQNDFVATDAFQIILADSVIGSYKYWDVKDLSRLEVELRKPGSSYKRVDLDIASKTYNCKNYGLKTGIDIEDKGELGGNPLQTSADYLMQQGLMVLESNMFAKFLATGVWGTDKVPTVKWDDAASNPIKDIRTGMVAVAKAGKRRPLDAVCSEDVFEALLQNEEILDRLPTNSVRIMTKEEEVASALGLKSLHVSRGYASTANEGASGDTSDTFGTEKFLLHYKSSVAPLQNPNAGLIIVRNYAGDVVGAKGMGITMPYFDEDTDSEILKLKLRFDMITPATSLGYLFYNVLT